MLCPVLLDSPFVPALLLAAGVLVFAAHIALPLRAERARRVALAALAEARGLSFHPTYDRELAGRLAHLRGLDQGGNRFAQNILSGTWRGHAITAFEFHYETTSTDSKGNRTTHHHFLQVLTLALGWPFPTLHVGPEGILSKIAQAVGYDDIDFESAEFSRRFCVRSADRRFAYAVCHAAMIEHLLAHPDLSFQVSSDVLAIVTSGKFEPKRLPGELDQLADLRELLPNYLFAA